MKAKLAAGVTAFVGATLLTGTVALANTSSSTPGYTSKVTTQAQQTYITLSIPNLNDKLQPAQTLKFTFTLGGPLGSPSATNPVNETGTLDPTASKPFTYKIPLPNYGKTETVWVSTSYSSNGYQYTSTAGPLIDTLPEAPLAALIPLGMVGIWFVNRRRKIQKNLSPNA